MSAQMRFGSQDDVVLNARSQEPRYCVAMAINSRPSSSLCFLGCDGSWLFPGQGLGEGEAGFVREITDSD